MKPYILRVSEALYALRDELDRGTEFPDAVWRIATKFHIKSRDLREAYDEFTSVPHNPEECL